MAIPFFMKKKFLIFATILSLSICVLLPFNTHFDNNKIYADETTSSLSKDMFIKVAVGIASANLLTFSCNSSTSLFTFLSNKFDEYATSIGTTTSALLDFTYNATLNGVVSVVANKVVIAQSCYNRAIDFINWLGGYGNQYNYINSVPIIIDNFVIERYFARDNIGSGRYVDFSESGYYYYAPSNRNMVMSPRNSTYYIPTSQLNIGDIIGVSLVSNSSWVSGQNYCDYIDFDLVNSKGNSQYNSIQRVNFYPNTTCTTSITITNNIKTYTYLCVSIGMLAKLDSSGIASNNYPFSLSFTTTGGGSDSLVLQDPLSRTQADLQDKIFSNTESDSMTLDIPNSIEVANETDLVNAISQVAVGDLAFALDTDIASDVVVPSYFTNLPNIISMPTCQTLSACLVQGVQTASSHITSFYNTHSELKNYINLSLVISVALMLLGVYR